MRPGLALIILSALVGLLLFDAADTPADDDGDVIVLVLTSATRGKLAGCG
ncbi:MAG: hypothetical protein GF399_08895 [Candidatus Coatesbacteria bacterium]|nr:hypothetical protein [Candidatus Coatesbacteria bacterium]